MTDWGQIAEKVEGTTMSAAEIAEKYNVDEDDVEERLIDENIEVCGGCGWWWDSGALDPDLYCPDCSPGKRNDRS